MGSVQATIDWRTATPEELDGHRCIITTVDGTIIDGYLKAIPPFTPEYQLTRFVLHDRDLCLGQLRILSLNPKHGTAILQPHIRSLTVTRQTKQPTNEIRNEQRGHHQPHPPGTRRRLPDHHHPHTQELHHRRSGGNGG